MTPIVRFSPVAPLRHQNVAKMLTTAELSRREGLRHARDRDAYTAAHVLVRRCAAELLRVPAIDIEINQHCPDCDAPHGRPSVVGHPDLHVSLSHTRGHVAAAAAWRPIGIDVEAVRPVVPSDRALTSLEKEWLSSQPDTAAAFIHLWVRKEALVKAGFGTMDRLDVLDVLAPPPNTELATWRSGVAIGAWATTTSPSADRRCVRSA